MRDPQWGQWEKELPIFPRENTAPPGSLAARLPHKGQPQGMDRVLVGGPDLDSEGRLWATLLVYLFGLDDNMCVGVPDGVLNTHLILWTDWDADVVMIMPILEMGKQTETVNNSPMFSPKG